MVRNNIIMGTKTAWRAASLIGCTIIIMFVYFSQTQIQICSPPAGVPKYNATINVVNRNHTTSVIQVDSSNSNFFENPCEYLICKNTEEEDGYDDGMLTINSVGRLGNQMSEYAIMLGIAYFNKRQAFLEPLMAENLLRHFRLTTPVIGNETLMKTKWTEFLVSGVLTERHKRLNYKYLRLTEYPASWTFFHPHLAKKIKREFKFHDHVASHAQSVLASVGANRSSVTYIGVHVRRGDYINYMKERKGVVADRNYFIQAMSIFRKKYSDAVFVVVSNDMKWCQENMDNSNNDIYYVGDGNESMPIQDLCILAHCNHSIITLGTFGFWAAYLAGGEAIYLTKFTTPESNYQHMHSSGAYFLKEWIGIPADLSSLSKST